MKNSFRFDDRAWGNLPFLVICILLATFFGLGWNGLHRLSVDDSWLRILEFVFIGFAVFLGWNLFDGR